MEIIPAIDLREGLCAAVLGADSSTEAIRSEDVVEQAVILRELGAEWIHITDLDGAFSGRLCNLRLLQELVELPGLRIQHSGGVHSVEHIDTLLALGVARVVMGASILHDRELTARMLEKYGDSVIPGVDGRDGMVAIEGFEALASTSVRNRLLELKSMGFQRLVYTDLRRCGAMKGPNFEGISEIMETTGLKMMIAGGINSYAAIQRLKEMGAEALIIGKAIYTGAIDLRQAEAIARG